MPVSLLHAGADAAEVERVLGRPTMSSPLDALGADGFLIYDSEPVRTEVTLTSGHVTAMPSIFYRLTARLYRGVPGW
jgi:hypothetical protein